MIDSFLHSSGLELVSFIVFKADRAIVSSISLYYSSGSNSLILALLLLVLVIDFLLGET